MSLAHALMPSVGPPRDAGAEVIAQLTEGGHGFQGEYSLGRRDVP
jgi:hypothetical protein